MSTKQLRALDFHTGDEVIGEIQNLRSNGYPFLNDLPVDDWQQFLWMRAGHRLAFLVPNEINS